MDPNELVTIYATTKPTEAEMIKNMLEAEGIRCEVANESQAGLSGILEIPILVTAPDQARAQELIASHGGRRAPVDLDKTLPE